VHLCISALFPSALSVTRYGSTVTLPVNNAASIWGRLRAMNLTVSNFMASTKILSTTKSTTREAEVDDVAAARLDIGRCVSLPDLKQKFLRSAQQRSAVLPDADSSTLVSET